ncbi:MAG: diacylglycerol kinase family lipid kinase [Deltaproteobacteria bacterium]|nr:diacylglycerol kinase family lipid kinase [Deltaproteobacteria bacterium]
MKTVAIVNPVAGFRRAPHAWPGLLSRLGARASQVVTWWTKGPGHAEFLAAQARRSGFDRVLAVGGDGTIFEVANGLWWESEGRLPSLGIVPFGTGCDYVRNFEVGRTPFAHLLQALGESVLSVDLAVFQALGLQGRPISRVCLNVMGAGFDAQVIARYHRQKILKYGRLPYFLSGLQELFKLSHFRLHGEIDGEDFEAVSLIFVVGLGQYFGGGMMVTPWASPQSGRVQLVWDQQISGLDLIRILSRIYLGGHLKHPKIQTRLARKVKLTAEPPILVEADGELVGLTPLEVEIYPGAFQVAAGKQRIS